MKKRNIIIGVCSLLVILGVATGLYFYLNQEEEKPVIKETDGEKFAREYKEVTKDNVFVFRNMEEITKIIENGTGIVYLGFPECPWCQRYVLYLNEVAKDNDVEKIYYYNIKEDRKNNTKEYLKLVELLSDNLQFDEEGNKRIYAPSVIALNKGEIVGFDDETAWDTKGYKTPDEYWSEDEVKDLKEKLEEMILKTKETTCSNCNK